MNRRFLLAQILFILAIVFIPSLGKCQQKLPGFPFVENYLTEETLISTENRTIIQDEAGVVYVGNSLGVIQFNGKNWDSISVKNKSRVRSLAIGKDQRMYVGAQNEMGYIDQKDGLSEFVSLKSHLPAEERTFEDVWKIHSINNKIYFTTNSRIFIWDGESFEIIKPEDKFHFSTHAINSALYVFEEGKGLFVIENDTKKIVEKGEFIANYQIYGIVPYTEGKLLIYALNKGLLVYDNVNFSLVDSSINELLYRSQVYDIIKLSNGYYAFATIQNGVIILDESLKVSTILNKKAGLYSSHVNCVFEDKKGNLWVGTENSVSLIHLSSPFMKIDSRKGLSGMVQAAASYKGYLFIGTSQGLFKTTQPVSNNKENRFELVNPHWHVWNFQQLDEDLFISLHEGLYRYNGVDYTFVDGTEGVWKVLPAPGKNGSLLLGSYHGAYLLDKNDGQWNVKSKLKGIEESFRIFENDQSGNVWMQHPNIGLYCFSLTEYNKSLNIEYFLANEEKPDWGTKVGKDLIKEKVLTESAGKHQIVSLTQVLDTLRFISATQFLLFDHKTKQFIKDKFLNSFAEDGMIHVKEDSKKLWILTKEKIVLRGKTKDGNFQAAKSFVLPESLVPGFELIYDLNDSTLLLGTHNGALLLNHEKKDNKSTPKVFLGLVTSSGTTKSTLLNNNFNPNLDSKAKLKKGELSFTKNNIQFTFFSPSYEIKPSEFSYQLDGFDKGWSNYTAMNFKEYTNLEDKDYTFKIKARDNMGRESDILKYHFKVLSPWYKTGWSYIAYLILLILFILILAKLYIVRIRLLKKKHLQKLRQQRTAAFLMVQQNKLAQQNKELINQVLGLNRQKETLDALKEELSTIAVEHPEITKVATLARNLKKKIVEEDDWKKFEAYFDQVHNNFLSKLKQQYPQITSNDLRLCAYIRMNLSSKEIAGMLNLSPRGIETSRYRLRKKLNLTPEEDLNNFILSFK